VTKLGAISSHAAARFAARHKYRFLNVILVGCHRLRSSYELLCRTTSV